MCKTKEIEMKIDEMRKRLNELLKEKKDPLDREVIRASQILDEALNEYHKIIKKK